MANDDDSNSDNDKVKLTQISVYLHPDELFSLDELVLERRKATGEAVRRNHLIREAIQEFLKQQQEVSSPSH
jgi:hypothetical protein